MSDLILEGLNLALFGMGFVFSFLIVLVVLMSLMSAVINRLSGAEPDDTARPQQPREGAGTAAAGPSDVSNDLSDTTRLVAVISAAVRQYQLKNRKH